ncbi:MAG: adenine deaminase [Bacteroidia bacterium]
MEVTNIKGNVVDIFNKKVFYAEVVVKNKKIVSIQPLPYNESEAEKVSYLMPGFIDSHVHIESALLVPAEFAKLAVVHGTVATISDPHEIANVCGDEGIKFMIANGKTVPFKFYFGAPSCVPATTFETAGANLNAAYINTLLQNEDIFYLTEVMNFPGVLNGDAEVIKKIASAIKYNKPIDGHAPGLMGDLAKKYIQAGKVDQVVIATDHECFTAEEALDKLKYGMKILIREGSAAKNFDALIYLMHEHSDNMMFCSDDKHPDSLVEGHINELCARAIVKGIDVFKILQAACINPVLHYKLNVGLLRVGDPADFIVVDDLIHFNVQQTYINGQLVADAGKSKINTSPPEIINQFNCTKKSAIDFSIDYKGEKEIPIIEALDGQLITNKIIGIPKVENNKIVADVANDILKIVVVNRYSNAPITKAFIKNFGIKQGAIASSVAHDSHNIVAVGTDDGSLMKAVNLIIEKKGGISAVSISNQQALPLPIAGLMSNEDGYSVAKAYTLIDKMAKEELGATLKSPFMTLSFMALLVIPHIKLSDKGLFDGDAFKFVDE